MSQGQELFAVSAPGLEQLVCDELRELGCAGTVVDGGVEWVGSLAQMRQANLRLCTASRVLLRLGRFRARTFFELERHATALPWSFVLPPGRAIELRVTARKSKLYHEGAIAERLFNIIGSQGQRVTARATEEEGASAQLLIVRVWRDTFTISADSSGALLHRRGYRLESGKAPLRETLAAAMLRAVHWTGREPLLDPFCGAGTIVIEAALRARHVAPGLARADRAARSYAFEQWPQHDESTWQTEIAQAAAQVRERAASALFASDRDAGAIRAARENARRAGVEADIEWSVAPLSAASVPPGTGWLITNPPYGQRVSAGMELRDLYAALGRFKREQIPSWQLALLSADARLSAQTQLPLLPLLSTNNGGIPVTLLVSSHNG